MSDELNYDDCMADLYDATDALQERLAEIVALPDSRERLAIQRAFDNVRHKYERWVDSISGCH